MYGKRYCNKLSAAGKSRPMVQPNGERKWDFRGVDQGWASSAAFIAAELSWRLVERPRRGYAAVSSNQRRFAKKSAPYAPPILVSEEWRKAEMIPLCGREPS